MPTLTIDAFLASLGTSKPSRHTVTAYGADLTGVATRLAASEGLERFAKEKEREWGYMRVATPHITQSSLYYLYYLSAHLLYFSDDLVNHLCVTQTSGLSYR